MLHLICGADRLELTNVLLARICARAQAQAGGNILIVPEQYSHETERALCRAGGDTISRWAEVLSFTRLSSRVATQYGGVCAEYLDEGGRILTMYLAAQQLIPQLKYYAAAATKPSFLQQLSTIVEEFLSACLIPQDILRASECCEGQFAQKLRELGLLYESYLSICKTGRDDPVTRLYRLREQLFETDYAADKTFFLDGFSDFTAAQLQIIEVLLPRADVTLALLHGGEEAVFSTTGQTLRTLRQLANKLDVPVTVEHISDGHHRAPDTQFWLDSLFSHGTARFAGAAPHIFTHTSESISSECAFAAAWVRQLTGAGVRFRDLTIALTEPGTYLPLLRATFARGNIPAYFSGSTPLPQQPTTAALCAALRTAEHYEAEDVAVYLKSALCPLSPDAADRLERYAWQWELRGLAWERPFTMNPRGFGEGWTEEDRATLAALESWRTAAITPLQTLRQQLRAAQTIAEQTEAVAAYLERTALGQTLAEKSARQTAAAQPQLAQQTQQLYDYLLQALEQLWQIAGRQIMGVDEFLQLLSLLLGCYQIGTIPAKADEVLVGGLMDLRHRRTPYLLILGAEEGKFPAFQTSIGLLSEDERTQLTRLGLPLGNGQETRLDRELGWLYAALSSATATVVLSTGGGQPSYLVERTKTLFSSPGVLLDADFPYAPDAASLAAPFVREQCAQRLAPYPALQNAAQTLSDHSGYTFTPLAPERVKALYGAELSLSASRIDKFAACKYQYFLQYGLQSKPWKPARFDAPIFGTFVHAVLEETVNAVMMQGGFHAVAEDALLSIAEAAIDRFAEESLPDLAARGARVSRLFARTREEVLEIVRDISRELRKSAFRPVDTELSFARDGALPPVQIRGMLGRSRVSGFVDRVDLYDAGEFAYYRVIDYKTGRKDFDYASILEGEGLQMLIYLFALRRFGAERYGKPILPAGVLYVPSRADIERIDPGEPEDKVAQRRQKKHRRKGLVLAEEAVLRAMEQDGKLEYLPVQEKKDGLCGDIATREQLAMLERFVTHSIESMTDALCQGSVTPDPLVRGPMASSCQFCDYRTACHQDLGQLQKRYRASVKAEQFWEEVERRLSDVNHTDPGTTGRGDA